jgi:hypothetical protein
MEPGQRVTHHELQLSLRATRGGQHTLELPDSAVIQSVNIDAQRVTLRPEQGVLTLPVKPGEQSYTISWRQPQGIRGWWQSTPLTLGAESVNAHINVTLPQNRWLLWMEGPHIGPAILFWSQLIVVLITALILGYATHRILPLSTGSWFLLGIGLTQVTLYAGLVVVAWFLLLYYRSKFEPDANGRFFNVVQIGVVLLTLLFMTILFWSVQQGLLGYPSMQVEGNFSSAYQFNWYLDRLDEDFPRVTVISVPIWVYRGLMLAWALWLAFSLLSWLKWGWIAFSKGNILWQPLKFNLGKRARHTDLSNPSPQKAD